MTRPSRLTVLLLILVTLAALELWARLADPPPATARRGDRLQRPVLPPAPADGNRVADQAVTAGTSTPTPAPAAVPLAQALQLFGPADPPAARRPPPPAPTPAPMLETVPAEVPPPPPPPVRARGLFSEPGQAPQVLLEDSRGEVSLLRVGASLDGAAGGWVVEALDTESVVLRQRDGERRHRLGLPATP